MCGLLQVDMYGSLVRADQLFDPNTPLLAAVFQV